MGLNKQKGNMYGFVTHTWNTIKGACPHDCLYCYMKRFGKQPELHFDEKELKTDLGSGNFIFVGSSCDMFTFRTPTKWIVATLEHCREFPGNNYLFQTKNPKFLLDLFLEKKFKDIHSYFCLTLETNRYYDISKTSAPIEKASKMRQIYHHRMVTIEPIMDFDLNEFVVMLKDIHPIQINIGANTNRKVQLPEPPKEKVLELIAELEKFTKVYQKDNLKRIIGEF